jgi:hypothetical protein
MVPQVLPVSKPSCILLTRIQWHGFSLKEALHWAEQVELTGVLTKLQRLTIWGIKNTVGVKTRPQVHYTVQSSLSVNRSLHRSLACQHVMRCQAVWPCDHHMMSSHACDITVDLELAHAACLALQALAPLSSATRTPQISGPTIPQASSVTKSPTSADALLQR